MTTTKEMNTLSFDGGSTLYTITDTTSRSNIGTLSSLNTTDKTNLVAAINEVLSTVSSVYKFKGSVANYAALPATAEIGDVYNVEDTGANYAYTEDGWDKLSETIDLSGYQTLLSLTNKLNADFIQDGTTNKTVTATEKSTWNGKQNANTAVTHTASTAVGSGTQPVYIASDGTATTTSFSLAKSVPADAVFTDTTYNNFIGANGSTAGTAGLVPAPSATDNTKFLKGDGTWATVSGGGSVDQSYDPTSENAQSGTAVAEAVDGLQSTDTAVTHTASTAVGSAVNPVFVASDGTATATTYSLEKSVPSDAIFTDTTYDVFTGADGSSAGSAGLVKAPTATDNTKFLKGDGTWANTPDTDTKNTAGATNTSSKIYLIGAEIQDNNPQTYSQDTAFVDVNGRLNSAAPESNANDTTVATTKWVKDQGYTDNVGTVTSVNNTSPINGNVSLNIPTITDTYSSTSSDGMSGKAVASAISNKADSATSLSGYGITDAYTKTEVDGKISSVYKPAGSIAYTSLPTLASEVLGNVYNITDSFTTDSRFVEGAGKSYPAGTNVVVVNTGTSLSPTYQFDVLSGFVDLSGYVTTDVEINGKNLSGNINLTASDIGALPDDTVIPSEVTESTVSGWGFTKNTGTVTSVNNITPVNGNVSLTIPSEVTETTVTGWGFTKNTGTVVTVNNTSADTNGNVTLSIPSTTDAIVSGGTDALTSGGAYTNLVTSVVADLVDANKINVTKAGSVTTITIDNVASATTASKLGNIDVGSITQPIYLSNGTATACMFSLAKSVPADAVFTDTTYSVMTGADGSTAGTSGLVPQPIATDNDKFLKGDGTWASPSVSGAATLSGNNTFTGSNTFSSTISLGSSASATTQAITDNDTSIATTAFARMVSTHQPISTLSSGTIALANGVSVYRHTPSGATTYTISSSSLTGISATTLYTFELWITMNSIYTLTFSNVTWQDGETPDMSSTGTYFLAFRTINGGSTWLGNLQGKW